MLMTTPQVWWQAYDAQYDIAFQNWFGGMARPVREHLDRCRTEPMMEFQRRILRPYLFRCQGSRPTDYMSVQPVKEAKGKHHIHAQALTDLNDPEFAAELYQHAFVSNRLNTGDNWSRIRGPAIEYAKPPMERLVGRGPILFTFEIDDQNLGALEIQLGWCLPGPWSKRWSHSKIGQLFQAMSRYDDFLGLTVNWSGNKSLHVHLVFDLDPINRLLPQQVDIRGGLVAHWDRLRPEVAAILGTEQFDPALRLPEQYRRLPQGGRSLAADNILEAPAGTLVPQLTVWEKYRDRRGKETIGLMFQPGPFIPNPTKTHRTPTGSSTRQSIGDLTPDEHQHCVGELAQHFPNWPKLARLAYEDGEWRAHFFNHDDDRNPASVMREGHSTVLFQGWDSEALVASSPHLPDRLGVMMAEWIDRFHGRDTDLGADAGPDTETLTLQAENVPLRALTPQEKAYGEACRDYDSLKHETARLILNNLPQHDRLWVRGGEGSHKTRSMLANHGRVMVGRDHRLAMYAFDSYLKAVEKVREFNEQGHRHYHAVLLKSFSRSYGETCERLALDPWTPQSARDGGFATVWHAMAETQEAVYQSLKDEHAAMWAEIGTKTPVLMTVHYVMQQWPECSMTRWYWHRDWFTSSQKLGDRPRLRDETRLGLAVHDEIDQSAIVIMARWNAIQWVQTMAAHPSCRSWCAKVADETAMAGEFDAYVAHHGGRTDVDFALAMMIRAHGRKNWQQVQSVNTGEYPRDENHTIDIYDAACGNYDAACGNEWGVVVTNWWNQLAEKVVVLTTELLPTVVATRADPAWYHLELNTPNLPRHEVRMRLDRRINKKEMQQAVDDLVAEIRPTLGDGAELHVVSNILKDGEVRSHKGARGSNGYIGKHVIQTMMHLSPFEYERLQVLNSWGNWDFAARLAHVDQFNQGAGRSLGPRRRGAVEHWLLVSGKLWAKIDEIMVRFSRYDFTLVPTGRQSKSRAR